MLNEIKKGTIVGTVLQDSLNQAKAVVDLSLNVANGKEPLEGTQWTLDDVKAVRVPYKAITKDNINDALEAYNWLILLYIEILFKIISDLYFKKLDLKIKMYIQ